MGSLFFPRGFAEPCYVIFNSFLIEPYNVQHIYPKTKYAYHNTLLYSNGFSASVDDFIVLFYLQLRTSAINFGSFGVRRFIKKSLAFVAPLMTQEIRKVSNQTTEW